MFLRRHQAKDDNAHSYWNVVENKRRDDGRVVQRHVLYLGEINSSQAAFGRTRSRLDEDAGRSRTLALFPEDRCDAITSDTSVVQLRLSEMRLLRSRQGDDRWLAGQSRQELQLDRVDRLSPSRKGKFAMHITVLYQSVTRQIIEELESFPGKVAVLIRLTRWIAFLQRMHRTMRCFAMPML